MQMNKNNGVQMVGVQVRLQEENVCPVVYVEPFFNEIRLGEPVEKVMNEIAKCMEEAGNAPFVHNGINPMDYDSVKEHLAVMTPYRHPARWLRTREGRSTADACPLLPHGSLHHGSTETGR